MITSAVGVELISTTALVDRIFGELPTPYLPKHLGKTKRAAIKEVHQLLTENTESIERYLSSRQNRYPGIVLPPEQYT